MGMARTTMVRAFLLIPLGLSSAVVIGWGVWLKRNNERNGQFVAKCKSLFSQGLSRKAISEVCVEEFGITCSPKDPTGDHSFRAWFSRLKPDYVELQLISEAWHQGKTTAKPNLQDLPVLDEVQAG